MFFDNKKVKFAPAAQVKYLPHAAKVKYCGRPQSEAKCFFPCRPAGTLHARSALHIHRMLHVPHKRNTSLALLFCILSLVKFAPAAQVKYLPHAAKVKYCGRPQSEAKCSANRPTGTLHTRSALHIHRMLHVPRKRNTSLSLARNLTLYSITNRLCSF